MSKSESESQRIKVKHLFILKATGLGVTELMLRFMAWLRTKDDSCLNSQMVIVTGPNSDIAIKLIKTLRAIFYPKLIILFENKETVLELKDAQYKHSHPIKDS